MFLDSVEDFGDTALAFVVVDTLVSVKKVTMYCRVTTKKNF